MTAKEEGMWLAYYHIDPFDDARSDIGVARLCELLWNIHRDSNKTDPANPEDFMPALGARYRLPHPEDPSGGRREPGELSPKASAAWFAMAARAFNTRHGYESNF